MSKLIVYRASAGSGKTFQITKEYLSLLFKHPNNYRHILAITFTNKASAEMKSRIIGELSNIANGNGGAFSKLFQDELGITQDELRRKAREILQLILHNYSFFSVGTIDSFFHRVMQSFVREIGLQTGVELELDNQKVLGEAINALFEDIDSDEKLKQWLTQFTEDKIGQGRGWNLKNDITSLGNEVFKEIFQLFNTPIIEKLQDKQFLQHFLENLAKIKNQFEDQMAQLGKDALLLIENHSLVVTDFSYGKSSFANYFNKIAKKADFVPGSRVYGAVGNVENWYSKKSKLKSEIEAVYDNGLDNILQASLEFFETHSENYYSATNVLNNFYTLGLLTDIAAKIRAYATKNSLFLLADVAKLLYTIIKDNEAPFVFEKIGNIYHHFMLDEFQDTSEIQWKNIKPLVLESLAGNNTNILVGDVKQSIYRWRNSNWKVLAEGINNDFQSQILENRVLPHNWRSSENIIQFNNLFFAAASYIMQSQYNQTTRNNENGEGAPENSIISAYANNTQKIPGNAPKGGLAYFEFMDTEEEDWKENVLQQLPKYIKRMQDKGIKPSEIAILTRRKEEGKKIADCLYQYSNQKPAADFTKYEAVSDESLFVSSSPAIKFIISILKYAQNPNDNINKAILLNLYENYVKNQKQDEIDVEKPFETNSPGNMEFLRELSYVNYLNLYESVEKTINHFSLFALGGQMAYLQSLQDLIIDFTRKQASDVGMFLKWWEQEGRFKSLPFTEGIEAIRILTIHKSKGLEFKAVIIPFCDWGIDHSSTLKNIIWCKPNKEPFNQLELLPVNYTASLENTIFKNDYYEEKLKAYIDNLNLLYVAFTRARDVLIAFGPDSLKNEIKNVSDLAKSIFQNQFAPGSMDIAITEKVYQSFVPDKNHFVFGNLGEIETTGKSPDHGTHMFDVSESGSAGFNLLLRKNSDNFFNPKENEKQGAVNYGKLMHGLFEKIHYKDDLDNALASMVIEGKMNYEESKHLKAHFNRHLNIPEVEGWFGRDWQVKTEASILLKNGHQVRPDRVIEKEGKIKVIDYKFGTQENEEHTQQVSNYIAYINEMGNQEVNGYLWYVDLEKVVEVKG